MIDSRPPGQSRSYEAPAVLENGKCEYRKIDCKKLSQWYNLVINVGNDWVLRYNQLTVEHPVSDDIRRKQTRILEHDISHGRARVHATLLKRTEKLLKRPGYKSSENVRWLFILLANPLFYSHIAVSEEQDKNLRPKTAHSHEYTQTGIPGPSSTKDENNMKLVHEISHLKLATGGSPAAQYSGLIKRILGLLSNLDDLVHQRVIDWISSSFTETQFQSLTNLIGSFVTYRLTRQHDKKSKDDFSPSDGLASLIPTNVVSGQALSAALRPPKRSANKSTQIQWMTYQDDWQIRAAARVMQLFFISNKRTIGRRFDSTDVSSSNVTPAARERARRHGQVLSTSEFYNVLLDYSNVVADFEAWESKRPKFSFCAYPFLLSIGAKMRILAHDARRQQEIKAREAFFDSLTSTRNATQYFQLRVRRDCLVEDSLREVAAVIGQGVGEVKKGLRVEFVDEAGIDAGGLRKEWFLLLARDLFSREHGLFLLDEESHLCYFNPFSLETPDQFYLVGAVLGLAIYNSTTLDVALAPVLYRQLLHAGLTKPSHLRGRGISRMTYTLVDLAQYRPSLARGLQQLLDFDGDVEGTFCRDFVIETDYYGKTTQVSLCEGGDTRPVTSKNRAEFVELYVRYMLEIAVRRQFEPFNRGFWQVCGGNAMSLFQSEELELLLQGSDEALDIEALKAVAVYRNWSKRGKEDEEPVVQWFWTSFSQADVQDKRALLSFITGSDRISAIGASNIVIEISRWVGKENLEKFPVARTCFNMLLLPEYSSYEELHGKLWRAVHDSAGFALK